MTEVTPGYVVDVTERALLVNEQEIPFSDNISTALSGLLKQLSAVSEARTAVDGPLRIHMRDHRLGGFGDAVRDFEPGRTVTGADFMPRPSREAQAELLAAAEEVDSASIFTEIDPIVDESVKTPINRGLTVLQRNQGFSLKSEARLALERREKTRRQAIQAGIAVVALLVIVRVVTSVLSGMGGEYAAVCVDTRLETRIEAEACTEDEHPYAGWSYYTPGESVPEVGDTSKTASDEPDDARVVNREIPDSQAGEVTSGGELKQQ